MTCPVPAYILRVMCMKKYMPLAAVTAVAVLMLLRPQAAAGAVLDGLHLCAGTVIPSLFPFFTAVSLLMQLGLAESMQGVCGFVMRPLFRMRGICALPVLAGLMGGYPSGARVTAGLYEQGRISRREAELLLGFCDNCGPAFLLGYVGAGIWGDTGMGAALYMVHAAAAVLTGAVLCRISKDRGPVLPESRLPVKPVSFPQALTAAVSGSVSSMLNICAFVVLFQVLAALPPEPLPTPVMGVLEMVSGLSALPPGGAGFVTAAAAAGWGGLSVHCQAMSLTAPAGLSFRWHWIGKAMQAGVSVILAAAIWRML